MDFRDNHEILNINRQDKRVAGIALLYSNEYKIKTVTHIKYNRFESRIWNIQSGSTHCTLQAVYHPPVGAQQGITNSIFINYLTELLTEVVSNHSNLIILGDINIHLNKLEDTDAKDLCHILEAFNITQHIKFPTQSLSHTLDIIATKNRQNCSLIDFCSTGG